jgi:uncharacterized protein (DUF305 family)
VSKFYLIALAGITLFSAPAFAENHDGVDHSKHGTHASSDSGNAVVSAFKSVNDKMHKDMSSDLTGDADVDFVRGMIPHHQGAIDMAKIQLEHGKDPDIRKLAQEVIAAQESEIALMKAWLTANDH